MLQFGACPLRSSVLTSGWRVEQTLESYAAPLGKQFLANGQSAPW